jgi:hypothetical protein
MTRRDLFRMFGAAIAAPAVAAIPAPAVVQKTGGFADYYLANVYSRRYTHMTYSLGWEVKRGFIGNDEWFLRFCDDLVKANHRREEAMAWRMFGPPYSSSFPASLLDSEPTSILPWPSKSSPTAHRAPGHNPR